ncbi:MAG TPA: hypothetical protein VHV83_03020 [Armatimonadota bacterium]|nr:hypothetical protein [Armatimonadota bacterium]
MKKQLMLGMTLVISGAVYAIPTITGPTGGYELPTAGITNGTTVAIDNTVNEISPLIESRYPNTKVVYGVNNTFEIGALYQQDIMDFMISESDADTRDIWNVNAKFALPAGSNTTHFAIGGVYGENQLFGTHLWNVYAAATTNVYGVKATANIGYQKLVEGDDDGLIGGISAEMPLTKQLDAGAELVFSDKLISSLLEGSTHGNLYANYKFSDNLVGRAAFTGIGQSTATAFGIAYTFGK